MHSFPRWVHHPEHKEKLVHSKEELEALGKGWGHDSSVWRSPKIEEVHSIPEVELEKIHAPIVEPEPEIEIEIEQEHISNDVEISYSQEVSEKPKQKGKKGGKQSA